MWAEWRRAAVPRARDPEIEALFPLSLGAHGLGPKTELFKTNDSDFHCWTMAIGGIKHQKPKNKQKNTSNKFFRQWTTATQKRFVRKGNK